MASSSSSLTFIPPIEIDGQKAASFATTDFADQINMCEKFLIGSFVGRRLPYTMVKETLMKIWNLKGEFTLTIHGESVFVFKFNSDDDRQQALEYGPVYIANRLFIVRPWKPFLE
ncbi:protein of unknown function DUF4283 [Macleaya cordata]|uniref:DUF4283 domain-containing protein n=1 Tax=Macleaya cordata TaxID=56857 RepID=A0A200R7Z4_MACCD|nr:protein of unknown function DUF4283 [Macleaya cordata]